MKKIVFVLFLIFILSKIVYGLENNEILLQAIVVEFNESYSLSVGLKLQQEGINVDSFENIILPNLLEQTSGIQFGGIYRNGDFVMKAILDAAENTGMGKVITSPKIVVNSSCEAILSSQEEEPVGSSVVNTGNTTTTNTQWKNIGVSLKAKPAILNDETTQVEIDLSFSNLSRFRSLNKESIPVRSERNLKTIVNLSNNEVWIVGGLFADKEIENRRGIPFLSNIPYVGVAFSGKHNENIRTQLIIAMSANRVMKKANRNDIYDDYKKFEGNVGFPEDAE